MKKSRFREESPAPGESVEGGRGGSTDWGRVPTAGGERGNFSSLEGEVWRARDVGAKRN